MRGLSILVCAIVFVSSTACGGSSPSTPTPPNQGTTTVTSVSVTGSTPAIGATTQFSAVASLSNGTTQNVTAQATWQSSNNGVATVNAAGVVTGVGPGQANISATFQSVSGQQQVTLSTSTTGFTVSGTVTDATSGGVLPGIAISSSDGKSTTTAGNGSYSIGSVASGSLTLTASATGYVTSSKTANVSGDTRVDFVLVRAQVPLSGSISVQNLPCVAPGTGNVTCTFVGSASGGTGPYTFGWQFVNPANGKVVPTSGVLSGAQVSPALGCDYAPVVNGVATFNASVTLTITPATGAAITINGTQQITRQKGSCGL